MIITAIWFYIGDIFIFGMLFSILSKLYKKKPVINWERTFRTVKSEKVRKIIEIIYLIVMLIFFFACVKDIVIPSVKDLPIVVTGTYEKERGYIERIVSDTVYIRSEDRDIIDITIRRRLAMGFEEGEKVIVWYYPNMKRGFLFHQD